MGSSPIKSTLKMKIDKIYILAINVTQDKIDSIKKRLDNCDFGTNIGYEILNGHDGRKDPMPEGAAVYEDWAKEPYTWNKFWQQPINKGEVGCALSHINAWHHVANGEEERCLVLEEDFFAVKSLYALPEVNSDLPIVWDYCALGRWIFNKDNDIILDETFCIPSLHYNMHAYILTKTGAQKLVDYQLEKNIIPSDEFITATYLNHRRQDIEDLFPVKTMSVIATREDWFNQSSDGETSLVSKHGWRTT